MNALLEQQDDTAGNQHRFSPEEGALQGFQVTSQS